MQVAAAAAAIVAVVAIAVVVLVKVSRVGSPGPTARGPPPTPGLRGIQVRTGDDLQRVSTPPRGANICFAAALPPDGTADAPAGSGSWRRLCRLTGAVGLKGWEEPACCGAPGCVAR